jgi:hypothetical protein
MLFAAEPWVKDPAKWSDKDIQRILNDSPWAKKLMVPNGVSLYQENGETERGVMSDARAGSRGMGGAPVGGGNMGDGFGGGGVPQDNGPAGRLNIDDIDLVIRWQSAAPVQAALLRASAMPVIDAQDETYSIAVILPSLPVGAAMAEAALVKATTLSWKAHEALHPIRVTVPRKDMPVFGFQFARTHPIELEDTEVEFATRLGAMQIRKKFKLKEMNFQRKLAL